MTTVKVVLWTIGLITATAIFTLYESHEYGVVAELKREDQERAAERQRAAAKEQQDEAVLHAYFTGQPIPVKSP